MTRPLHLALSMQPERADHQVLFGDPRSTPLFFITRLSSRLCVTMNTFLGLLVGTLGFHQAPFAALDASRRPVIRSHRTAAPVRAISWPLSAPTTDDAAGPLKVLYDSKCMVRRAVRSCEQRDAARPRHTFWLV